jgi:serine/threonine-protein phosphatase 2A regulatory subunit A
LSSKNDNDSSKNSAHLLKPLELIVACDDSVVRQKTVESLCSISDILDTSIINSSFLEMCKRLKKGDLFSKRIAACQLYAHVYDRLTEENRVEVRKKYAKLVKDDTPMVRRGAA